MQDSENEYQRNNFLSDFFTHSNFNISPLANDASFRSYARVERNGESFIFMDSSRELDKLEPFIKIAKFLSGSGFSTPQIYHADMAGGFLLLEDFGHIRISDYLTEQNAKSTYRLISDLLVELKSYEVPHDLPIYSPQLLLDELRVYTEWYVPYASGIPMNKDEESEFLAIWQSILALLPESSPCLVLRDYHVENMMFLDRSGIKALGLLDFQDALIGSPIYDLVSVLEDARREVPFSFASELVDYYASRNLHNRKSDILLSYHILGAQRNMRILGVFARKFLRDKNSGYLKYIPRVLKYLQNDLSHPALKAIQTQLQAIWYIDRKIQE